MTSPDGEKEVAASSTGSRLTDADFHENFNEVLAEFRERDPVHQDRQFDRVVLTRAADVEAAISDRSLY